MAVICVGRAATAGSSVTDVARLRLGADALEAALRSVLPAEVRLPASFAPAPGAGFSMTEVKYCGVGPKGSARLRAGGALAGSEMHPTVVLGCPASLAELAAQAKPALGAGTVLVDLDVSWKSWDLKVAILHAFIIGGEGQARAWSAGDKRVELAAVSTADLRIDTATGSPIVLHASPTFRDQAVDIALVSSEKRPGKSPQQPAASDGMGADQANASVEIPIAMANQVLGVLTAKEPLSVAIDREQLDVRGLVLAAEGTDSSARLTLSGIATLRSLDEDASWSVLSAGDPLRVSSLKVSAQYEDCASLGTLAAVACNVRNGGRTAAATGAGSAATQRYQGRLVHDLANPLDLRLTFAGQRIVLPATLLRTWLSQRGLCAAARIEAGR